MLVSGELQSVDGYMNIALEQTKEIIEGRVRRNYGDAFIRGNNGEHDLTLLAMEVIRKLFQNAI